MDETNDAYQEIAEILYVHLINHMERVTLIFKAEDTTHVPNLVVIHKDPPLDARIEAYRLGSFDRDNLHLLLIGIDTGVSETLVLVEQVSTSVYKEILRYSLDKDEFKKRVPLRDVKRLAHQALRDREDRLRSLLRDAKIDKKTIREL